MQGRGGVGSSRRAWRLLLSAALIAQCVTIFVPTSAAIAATPSPSVRWPSPTWHIGAARTQSGPNAVDADAAGNVYVADTENDRISKFDVNGVLVARWGAFGHSDGLMDNPMGVSVDAAGTYVYVADTGNHRIQKFTAAGVFVAAWGKAGGPTASGQGPGEFDSPEGVEVDALGQVYVADTGNARVQKFGANGTFLAQWGTPGDGDAQFLAPCDVAIDSDQRVYVVDRDADNSNVKRFDEWGTPQLRWGGPGNTLDPGVFTTPSGITVGSNGRVYVTDTGKHRIQSFAADGTSPKVWGEWGTRDGVEMNGPTGIATYDGASGLQVLVADRKNDRIRFFDDVGTSLKICGSHGLAAGRFYEPSGIAIDPSGAVYVSEAQNHRLQKFGSEGLALGERPYFDPVATYGNNNGDQMEPITTPIFHEPLGLALDKASSLFVADSKNHRIMKRGSENSMGYITKWGMLGSGNGFFDTPSAVAVGSASGTETVYVADTGNGRIQLFDIDGVFRGTWGYGQLSSPRGVAVDSTSSVVYVADTGNHRIAKFSTGGTLLGTWGTLGSNAGQLNSPWGVALDRYGNVYVADTGNNRVQIFDPEGELLGAVGSQGSEAGKLERPRALSVAPDGRIYVADTGNHRVHVFTPPVSVSISGVTNGGAYNHAVTPVVSFLGLNLTETGITLNGTPWVPSVLVNDGSYNLVAWAFGGSELVQKTVHFLIDTVKPSTTSNAQDDYTGRATITLTPSDDRSGVKATKWRIDGQAPWHVGTTVQVGQDGDHTLEFYSEDNAGNIEAPANSVSFYVDNPDSLAPTTSVSGVSDGWANQSVTFTLTGDDGDGSGVDVTYYRLNAGPIQTYEGPTTVDVDTAGTIALSYWSVDYAENIEAPKTTSIKIDKVSPSTTAPPSGVYYSPAHLQLSATDTGGSGAGTTHWRVAPSTTWKEGTVAEMTGTGSQILEYYSTDAAGNSENMRRTTYTLRVDATAPTMTYAVSYGLGTSTVSLTATDNESGVDYIEYQINNGAVGKVAGASAAVPVVTLGTNEFKYRSFNKVGVASTWRTLPVVVKNTIVSLSAPSVCSYKSATLSGYARFANTSGALEAIARRYVRVERWTAGGWVVSASVLTDASGHYSVKVSPTTSAIYRVSYEGSPSSYLSASSPQRTVMVKAGISKPGLATTKLKVGKAYRASGTIKPGHPSGSKQLTLRAYRYIRGKYVYKKSFSVKVSARSGYSKYSSSVKLRERGKWRLRIMHPADTSNAESYSAYRYVTVK